MLFTTPSGRELLGIGQKSGVFWTIDPDSGELVWKTIVGPGGYVGGHMFGAATDGVHIYVQTTNIEHHDVSLVDGTTTNGGYWSCLDAETGKIIWQTSDPSADLPLTGSIYIPNLGAGLGPGYLATPQGPLTLANGVVYAGSMDPDGHMYAMNSDTGEILWSFASGGSVNTAPTIINGVLYWGSGYRNGINNNKFFAFSIPNEDN